MTSLPSAVHHASLEGPVEPRDVRRDKQGDGRRIKEVTGQLAIPPLPDTRSCHWYDPSYLYSAVGAKERSGGLSIDPRHSLNAASVSSP